MTPDTNGHDRLRIVRQTVRETVREKKPAKPKPRDPYRGVCLVPPDERNPSYRARYTDPETGRTKLYILTAAESRVDETRQAVRKRIHTDNRRRREEIDGGAAPHTAADMKIADALDQYFKDYGARIADGTRAMYQRAADNFAEWAKLRGLHTVRQINKAQLRAYANARAKVGALRALPGGKAGEKAPSGTRSDHTFNKDLRCISAVLNALRDADVLRISSDDLGSALKRVRATVEKKEFLSPPDLRKLLETCIAYDATRAALPRGPRNRKRSNQHERPHAPITPVILFLLLTGSRVAEALALDWAAVVGDELQVPGRITKTRRYRVVDISISPLLAALVSDPKSGRVLGAHTTASVNKTRRALVAAGAPDFTFHGLRRTCGTYLTCAPSIYGAAAAYMSAKRLDHSVKVAETNYVGVIKISPDARTIEAAMQLDAIVDADGVSKLASLRL